MRSVACRRLSSPSTFEREEVEGEEEEEEEEGEEEEPPTSRRRLARAPVVGVASADVVLEKRLIRKDDMFAVRCQGASFRLPHKIHQLQQVGLLKFWLTVDCFPSPFK